MQYNRSSPLPKQETRWVTNGNPPLISLNQWGEDVNKSISHYIRPVFQLNKSISQLREVALQNIPIYRHSRAGGNLSRQWIPAFAGMTMGYSYLLLPLIVYLSSTGFTQKNS